MEHVNPLNVVWYNDFGSGNMGTASDDENIKARFGIPDKLWMLFFVRIHFGGSASGSADVDIVLRSKKGDTWNLKLYTLEARGPGLDLHFRIPEDELAHWLFEPGDELVIEWTNPDVSDDIQWGLTVGMLPVPAE